MAPQQTFDFIINRRSGTVLNVGEEAVVRTLRDIFGERAGEMTLIEGRDIASSVRDWTAAYAGDGRGLIVCGGDGTVLTAAGEVMGTNVPFGVLPFGTNNLFSRQLGFAADFKKAAGQYAGATLQQNVDVGRVNGMNFLVGLLLDKNSARFFEAREAARDGKIGRTLKEGAGWAFGTLRQRETLSVTHTDAGGGVSTQHHSGTIFAVTNNLVAPRSSEDVRKHKFRVKDIIENMFTKSDLGDGQLGLYSFKGGVVPGAGLLRGFWKGTWLDHSAVTHRKGAAFRIEPVTADTDPFSIILDGEIRQTQHPLNVEILPGALRVFRPA